MVDNEYTKELEKEYGHELNDSDSDDPNENGEKGQQRVHQPDPTTKLDLLEETKEETKEEFKQRIKKSLGK